MDVVGVGIQSPAAVLHHGAHLIGLGQGGIGGNQNIRAGNVENAAQGNNTALGPLGINRPGAPQAITGRDIRQPVVVVDRVRHKLGAADAGGSADAGISRSHSAQAADRLSIVLVLIEGHGVIGGLHANREYEFRRRVPFEFGKRLRGLSNEMLVEVP